MQQQATERRGSAALQTSPSWGARLLANGLANCTLIGLALVGCALLGCALLGCGVEERPHAALPNESATDVYAWPEQASKIATIKLKQRGEIRIALYRELAPTNVESFASLAKQGFYDGLTFHRVIPDFMIQTGDPLTRDDDPRNDGKGGLPYTLDDEFSDAPFVRGVVAVANLGRANSGGSQFFIMHKDRRGMDGTYTVLGKVVAGLHLVDDVALTQTDVAGRWGPPNRPLEDVVIEEIRVEDASGSDAGGGREIADAGR